MNCVSFAGAILAVGTLGVMDWALAGGLVVGGSSSMDYTRTLAFTTLVFFQLFNVFNARFDDRSAFHRLGSNRWLARSAALRGIAGAAALEIQFAAAEPVWAALNHLPEHYCLPLLLQLAAAYPLHTIAATLGCNVNTIKTRLRRARLRFRQHYGATEESGCERGAR